MSKPIRVGLIRCDSHGLWFGPLMMKHDPLLFQRPMDPDAPIRYFWQTGMNHRHFYAQAALPKTMTAPFIEGFDIVKLWDEHRDVAELAARIFLGRPKVCDTFEEVSDEVDLVFVADANYDGSDHLQLATPGLRKGVATFVDKPLSNNIVNARKILEMGKEYGAPVFSLSILRADPMVAALKHRLEELAPLNLLTLSGCGTVPAGLIHSISTVQHLCGPGIRTVQTLVAPKQTIIHLEYGERAGRDGCPLHGAAIHCNAGNRNGSPMSISLLGKPNDIHLRHPGDPIYPFGAAEILKMILQMMKTRSVPANLMAEVIESVALVQAVHRSIQTGRTIDVGAYLA
jgi:predicted dehydrogenase